jgi:potassium-transporting ATPase potassium-binding subunit
MTLQGWLQIGLFSVLILAITKPLGAYMYRVFEGSKQPLPRFFGPIERFLYWLSGVDPKREQNWQRYALALLAFSLFGIVATYGILRLQDRLPLNPQGLPAVPEHLAFNTSVSFNTNTNWQSYVPETTMSYLSEMAGLAWHNFVSAGAGIAVALAVARGLTRRLAPDAARTIGNFWVDLIRSIVYVLMPISVVVGLFLVTQGIIQNFSPYQEVTTLDGGKQTIAMGPVASQEVIKELGTNGGGFFNANSAHPFENPTPLTNFVELLLIFSIGAALTYTYGRMAGDQRQGWAIFAAMSLLFLTGVTVAYWAESGGNPVIHKLEADLAAANPAAAEKAKSLSENRRGLSPFVESSEQQGTVPLSPSGSRIGSKIAQPQGNMEGKEVRFGVSNSALFATVTTDTSCGAVNSMHDSFTPLGGLVPLANIQLGELIFGGVGAGLYAMLVFVILSVFIAGLMVGRTPEYLGKKIESREMKYAMFYILIFPAIILGFAGWSAVYEKQAADFAKAHPAPANPPKDYQQPLAPNWYSDQEHAPTGSALNNSGPHGLSEMLYAYSSAAGNNGSAFAGINANTNFWNVTMAVVMLAGRFLMIVPVLAIAGSMVGKKTVAPGLGTFPTNGPLFTVLLVGVIVIVGALTFFPAQCLGPIVEHFLAGQGKLY